MSNMLLNIDNAFSIVEFTFILPLLVFITEFILTSTIFLAKRRISRSGTYKNILLRLFFFLCSRIIGILLFITVISSIRAFDYFVLDLFTIILISIVLSIVANSIFIVYFEEKEYKKSLKLIYTLLVLFSSLVIALSCIIIVYGMGV